MKKLYVSPLINIWKFVRKNIVTTASITNTDFVKNYLNENNGSKLTDPKIQELLMPN